MNNIVRTLPTTYQLSANAKWCSYWWLAANSVALYAWLLDQCFCDLCCLRLCYIKATMNEPVITLCLVSSQMHWQIANCLEPVSLNLAIDLEFISIRLNTLLGLYTLCFIKNMRVCVHIHCTKCKLSARMLQFEEICSLCSKCVPSVLFLGYLRCITTVFDLTPAGVWLQDL